MKFVLIILILALLNSCALFKSKKEEIATPDSTITVNKEATQPEVPPTPPIIVEEKKIDILLQNDLMNLWSKYFIENFNESRSLDIFIYTNRKSKSNQFGCTDNFFDITESSKFTTGVCRISVPKRHSTGELNINHDPKASSNDFFKVSKNREINENYLFEYLKKSKRTPLVFVHGFNVKYEEAVFRAAQIAYDVKYQGPIVLFTWPAGSGEGFFDDKNLTKTYRENSLSAKNSISVFKKFLSEFITRKINLNLIVHSMGHQVVIPALYEIAKDQSLQNTPDEKMINELIFNAPDFDAKNFIEISPLIKNIYKRLTLYCSENDKAMLASETVNKNRRLGSCISLKDIDSINVSEIDNQTFGLNHGYYSSRDVLTDVFQVLIGIPADYRLFMRKSDGKSTENYFLRP